MCSLKSVFLRLGAICSCLIFFYAGTSQVRYKTDRRLASALEPLLDSFHGTAGIYVRNLKTGREVALNADLVFPTASIIKVPILAGMFRKLDEGTFHYHDELVFPDSLKRGGSGLMQFFKDTVKVSLNDVITLMITHSDNSAAVWCEKMAGGGDSINAWLAANGFDSTRLNARTKGREAARERYGWGQTTPREMAGLFVLIREGKAVSRAASERMYRIMTHVFWDEYALSAIPPYVQSASKQGMVDDSRSEGVLVNAPHGDYVFYLATNKNKDQRWEPDNESWQLARNVSALLWHYFEPNSDWKPEKQRYFR